MENPVATRDNTPRLLGAAFLAVVVTSAVSGGLAMSALGSGGTAEILTHAASNEALIHWSTLAAMANAAGILVLASLLYMVLRRWSEAIALVALTCWLGEAFFYAIGQLGVVGLLPVGRDFVGSGSPAASQFLTLGQFLYAGIYKLSGVVLMFFYCCGAVPAYALFFRSNSIPRLISGYGVCAAALGLGAAAFELLGNSAPMAAYLPILPFELAAGGWLLFRGIPMESNESDPPAAEAGRRRTGPKGALRDS